ncbi:MAG TPA: TonB-dependent receptor [Cyclobacteriaceae bacterium]|nr:TonB-dependent receptor [Cyclobacteriaceae bacterium]
MNNRQLPKLRELLIILLMMCFSFDLLAGMIPGNSSEEERFVVVKGVVYDTESGETIPGVNILEKGTNNGTITDLDGSFTLDVADNATLVFSFVGYLSQEVAVQGQSSLDIRLSPDLTSLEEVIVIGYGSQRKQDMTGAVSVVKTDELIQQPTAQLTNQLQGRVSGVTITGSGQPGEAPQIRIRGINTFGNNDPLYIVDGVASSGINDINPNDVESMQVLKDAASASIYGSRAANGVIIITTKKGKGKVSVNYSGYAGVQTVQKGNPWNILSPQEMAELKFTALRNTNPGEAINDDQYGNGQSPVLPNYIAPVGANTVDESLYNLNPFYSDPSELNNFYRIVEANKEGTNWFQEIFNPASIQSHDIAVSGGSDQGNYFFSMNYFDQQGTLMNTYMKRYTLRSNTSFNITDNFRIGENLAFSLTDNPRVDARTEGSAIGMAMRQQPIIPVYDIRGNFAGSFGSGLGNAKNPVAMQERMKNNRGEGTRLFGNVYAELDFLRNFTARTSFGGQIANSNWNSFTYPEYENAENGSQNRYNEAASSNINWTFTNTLTYKNTFNELHNLSALIGSESYKNTGREVGGGTLGYFSFDPNFTTLSTGAGTQTNYSSRYSDALSSIFARVDYSFNEKYLFGATIRRDGSSRFLNTQYGWFPAVSAGWRISDESFMSGSSSWLDDLKIRGGYGIMGNQINVSPSNAFTTYGSSRTASYYPIGGTTIVEGFQQTRIGNPDAKWEKNINSNIGIDASLFQGRIQFTADYYRKDIDDLLFTPELIGSAGTASPPAVNIAQMTNQGIDMDLSGYFDLGRDFRLNTTITFTSYNNEIVNIADGVNNFDVEGRRFNGSTLVRNQVGHSVGQFFGYEIEGFWNSQAEIDAANEGARASSGNSNAVYQESMGVGRFRYADQDGNNMVTSSDRTFLGNPHPDFSYGLNIGLEYRSWDFSMFLYGVQGNEVWNNVKWFTDFYSSFAGAKSHTALYDSWTPQNHNATAPIQEGTGSFSTANVPNSYFVEDGSYLRARQMQLGYRFAPSMLERVGISNLRVYVQAVNLFTITGYSGLDPELSRGGTDTSFGIDEGSYPNQKQFIFGLNIGI